MPAYGGGRAWTIVPPFHGGNTGSNPVGDAKIRRSQKREPTWRCSVIREAPPDADPQQMFAQLQDADWGCSLRDWLAAFPDCQIVFSA
jgi:hypothetical protein